MFDSLELHTDLKGTVYIIYTHIFISIFANIHSMHEVNLLLLLLAEESFIYANCFYKLNADIISCTLQLKTSEKGKEPETRDKCS